MPRLDLQQMAADTLASIRGYTERAVAPVAGRVESLERSVAGLPSSDFVRAEVAGACSKLMIDLLATMAQSKDGKSISIEDVTPLVEKLVAALPIPKDGANGRDGRDGADGKSIDPSAIAEAVDRALERAAAASGVEAKAFADALTMRFTAAAID